MPNVTMIKEQSHAEQNASGWIETLSTAHEAYEFCIEEGEGRLLSREAKLYLKEHGYDGTNHTHVAEIIEEEMRESALSVEVRSGWREPGDSDSMDPEEFQILLSTGGPALRITGELDQHLEPRRCWMEIQDWGTPWSWYHCNVEVLHWFCSLFYFGEG